MSYRIVQKQHVKTYEQIELSEEEKEEIRKAFQLFDTDHTGLINRKELIDVIQSLGYEDTHENMKECGDSENMESSGFITLDEFLDLMTVKLSKIDLKENIQRVFHQFDHDKTGKISFRNLKRVAKELGETLTDAELLEMIERADIDQDGEVNFEEFYAVMTKQTFT
ncbi:unnamed protein product [Peronospora belbahrii]|uniref:EF-hand domain-containing protein n=1 Tax=Peronospora belbahrii TaxID=622444 RepID=A0ABN8D9H0_9STRA|nr:unnamed protein product [Peronospora belbahrii]